MTRKQVEVIVRKRTIEGMKITALKVLAKDLGVPHWSAYRKADENVLKALCNEYTRRIVAEDELTDHFKEIEDIS